MYEGTRYEGSLPKYLHIFSEGLRVTSYKTKEWWDTLVVYEELLALVPNEAYKTYLYTHLVCSVHESKQTAMESRLIRFDKDFDTACIKRYTTSPLTRPVLSHPRHQHWNGNTP